MKTLRVETRVALGVVLAISLCVVAFLLAGCSSQADSNASGSGSPSEQERSSDGFDVTFSIKFPKADDTAQHDDAFKGWDRSQSGSGSDASVTYSAQVSIPNGTMVIDLFSVANLKVVVQESYYGALVTSIDGIENDGPSGWVYTINGEQVMDSAENVVLTANDVVEWEYVEMPS